MRRVVGRVNDGLKQAGLPDEGAAPRPRIAHEGQHRERKREEDAADDRGEQESRLSFV